MSLPLNIRKTLSGKQRRQIRPAAGLQVAQPHLGIASKEAFGSDLNRTELDLTCLLTEVGSLCDHGPF